MSRALFVAILFVPGIIFAQELTPEQHARINQCTEPIALGYVDGTVTLEEYQFESAECYRSAGATHYLAPMLQSATSSAGVADANARATEATNALWGQEALKFIIGDLSAITLTPEQSLHIGTCIEKLTPQLTSSAPSAAAQRAIADCYRGTPYEAALTPLYEKIATVVDCSTDELGVDRVNDAVRLIQTPTTREVDIITKCYIERTAPVLSAVALTNVIAVGGARDAGLLIVMSASNLWLVVRRRKGDKFGTVVNSLMKIPVDLAIVRLIDSATQRVAQSAVTDRSGRFYIFGKPGAYTIEVTKPGFTFPSQFGGGASLAATASGEVLNDTTVQVDEASPVVQKIVPVDPVVQEPSVPRERMRRIGRRAGSLIGFGAPVLGLGTAALAPQWWVILLAVANFGVFFIFRYFARRNKPGTYGVVVNPAGAGVANAVIRIFDTQYNKLVATAVTDGAGRYGSIAGKGTYTVKCNKAGVGEAERTVVIAQDIGVIAEKIVIG